MSEPSCAPDISGLDIPMDAWTEPFWAGTAEHRLVMPCCADCSHFRWPPGPFCPNCQSQATQWRPAGEGRLYSFTVVREPDADAPGQTRIYIPALIEFPDAGGIRLLAAIAGVPQEALELGAPVEVSWSQAANATVPIFTPVST